MLFKKWRGQLNKRQQGYAPLLPSFNTFFIREMYGRIHDLWHRPISSSPGAFCDVMDRVGVPLLGPLQLKGTTTRCLNLSSYNYLGFSETKSPVLEKDIETLHKYGVGTCSARVEYGTTDLHCELERTVAEYVGKEAAIVYGMGYGTNSTTIPALVSKGCLIISDSLNHASIIVGCRASGATTRVFKHNNVAHLEKVLRRAISSGQPRTHRPWKKILIVVEGIYSMEGEICALPGIVELKKKYKCYLYLDEAHSIGAIGAHGRGVCEYWGVDPADVDIMMGTFTKSFAAVGGYIAGDKDLINFVRGTAFSSVYDVSMTTPMVQQIITVLNILMGKDGTDQGRKRIDNLAANVAYFRRRLEEVGFDIIGDEDSPVVPMMIYHPSKMTAFSRLCLENNIAVCVVSYPASELMLSRTRFCLSAAHTKDDLEKCLETLVEIGDVCMVRYNA